MACHVARWVACCVLVTTALVGCGGEGEGEGGDRPSVSPTASLDLPSPTRSLAPSPDASSDTPEPPPEEETTTDAPVESPEQSEVPESSPTPEPGDATEDDTDNDDGTPPWVWWVIGLAVVALGVLVIWLISRSRKRNAWLAELKEAEAEMAWFARTLLPGLRQTGSLEQVVGGWRVGATRVGAAEDRLTVLESSAPDDEDRIRARGLRDAVRLASGRMDQLATTGPHDSWALDLDDTIAGLEAALGPPEPATTA